MAAPGSRPEDPPTDRAGDGFTARMRCVQRVLWRRIRPPSPAGRSVPPISDIPRPPP